MKSAIFGAFPVVTLAMLLSACSGGTDDKSPPAEAEKEVRSDTVDSAPMSPSDAEPFLVKKKSESLDYSYGYPVEAAAIAALAAHLDKDAETKFEETQKAANEDAKGAKENNFPLRQHIYSQIWKRVAQTPRFLSLSSDVETYTGGAHGMVNFDTILWDRAKNVALSPLDIFTSADAFNKAATDPFCKAIVAAKKAKGIEPVADMDGVFEKCPAPAAHTIWLGSSDGTALDRLTIGITAYVVGPYVEGNYRIDLPMTAALVRAVKPEYAAFVKAKS